MNDLNALKLSEQECKSILNFFAKKAYGDKAEVEKTISLSFRLNIGQCALFIIGYDKTGNAIWSIGSEHSSMKWKDILDQMFNFISSHNGAYISYNKSMPHMVDESSSIEEALVHLNLSMNAHST